MAEEKPEKRRCVMMFAAGQKLKKFKKILILDKIYANTFK